MVKKLVINQDNCIGCGQCEAYAPKSFICDDSSRIAKVLDPTGDEEKDIQEAIDSCPTEAISWKE